ncbi:hypothetical protein BLOT_005858 [Blomia tropicalis]|nr:hypothetical protein BLOT_005858 [Blomia tropicalis]
MRPLNKESIDSGPLFNYLLIARILKNGEKNEQQPRQQLLLQQSATVHEGIKGFHTYLVVANFQQQQQKEEEE